MESRLRSRVSLVMFVCWAAWALMAQQSVAAPTGGVSAVVPSMINYTGVLKDETGRTLTSLTGVTFLLYSAEQGGAPLWLETQNVIPDKTGRYTVQLGSTSAKGLPSDLFVNGEARWLAVHIGNEAEQPRVLLVAVPYAMKAADAQTLGGLPPSAFVLATSPSSSSIAATASAEAAPGATSPALSPPPAPSTVTTNGGTVSTIPMFTTATNIQNSILTQTGTATINVLGRLNLPATGTATAVKGFNSRAQSFVASVFNSGSSTPVAQVFEWQAEPLNNDKTTASGTINLLYAAGTAVPSETGLRINSKGQFTFAPGQPFPGTITSVTAGTDLLGGGSGGAVTLNLDTTKVPQLAVANTFTANQKVNGTVTATSFAGNGANVTNVNAARLGGVAASAFAQLAANNTFTGNNTFNGSERMNTAFIGPINNFASGQLGVSSPSSSLAAIGAAGFTAASGSSQNGSNGIDSFGGSGDTTTIFNTGGTGISGQGGGGFNGGNGVAGLGGGGGPCCNGPADGDGGFFEGGSNSFSSGDGVYAITGSGYAGNFQGSINVTGAIIAGTKDFRIDHPLDPANKYLTHASVESSEMMNIYTGNVTTDGRGEATVALPDWFEVLNTDFRYQLTVIGQFAQAIIGQKIARHQFTIRTSVPNVEVSWQVTAVRHDAFAKANPLQVETEKEARLKGFFIHPELYGAPPERQMEWARHPQMMKQAKAMRLRQAALSHKLATAPQKEMSQSSMSVSQPN